MCICLKEVSDPEKPYQRSLEEEPSVGRIPIKGAQRGLNPKKPKEGGYPKIVVASTTTYSVNFVGT